MKTLKSRVSHMLPYHQENTSFSTSKQNCNLKSLISSLQTHQKNPESDTALQIQLVHTNASFTWVKELQRKCLPKTWDSDIHTIWWFCNLTCSIVYQPGGRKKRERKHMKHVVLPHDNSQLHWVLHFECSNKNFKSYYQEEIKRKTTNRQT